MPVPWRTIEADPEFQALDADGQYDIASRWQEKMKAQLPVEEHDPFLEASNNRLSKYFAPKAIQAAQLSQSLLGGVTSPLGAATALASGELQVEKPKPLELAPAIPSLDQTMPPPADVPAGVGAGFAPVAGAGNVVELLKTAKEAVSTPPWQGFGVEKIPASVILPGGAAVDLLFNSLGDSKAAQVIQGLHKAGNNQIENMANFMGSPLGVAMMGIGSLGPAAQRIVSLAFAGDMASSQPELWKRFQNATTLREKTETLADAVAGLGLTLTALKHGLTKAEKTAPAEPPPLPSPTPLTDAALGETSTRIQPQQETPNATQAQRIGQSVRPEPQGGTQGGTTTEASLGDSLQRPAAGETAPEVAPVSPAEGFYNVTFSPEENRYTISVSKTPISRVVYLDQETGRVYSGSTHGEIWEAVRINEGRKMQTDAPLEANGFYVDGRFVDRTPERNVVDPETFGIKVIRDVNKSEDTGRTELPARKPSVKAPSSTTPQGEQEGQAKPAASQPTKEPTPVVPPGEAQVPPQEAIPTQKRTLTHAVGGIAKGTEVTLTGRRTGFAGGEAEVEMPDGTVRGVPDQWLTTGAKAEPLPALVKRLGRQRVEELVGEWDQSARLSPDGKSIDTFADTRNQTGKVKASSKEFSQWVADYKQGELKPAVEGQAKEVTQPPRKEATPNVQEVQGQAQVAPTQAGVPSAAPEAVVQKVVPEYLQKAYDEWRAAKDKADQWFADNPEPSKGPRAGTIQNPMSGQMFEAAKARWSSREQWESAARKVQDQLDRVEKETLSTLKQSLGRKPAYDVQMAYDKLVKQYAKTKKPEAAPSKPAAPSAGAPKAAPVFEGPMTKEQLPNILAKGFGNSVWVAKEGGKKGINVVPLMEKYGAKLLNAIPSFVKKFPRGENEGLIEYRNRIKEQVPVEESDIGTLTQIIDGLTQNLKLVSEDIASESSPRMKRVLEADKRGVEGWIQSYKNELERVKAKLGKATPEAAPRPGEAASAGAPTPAPPEAKQVITVRGYHGSAEIARRGKLEGGLRLDISPSGRDRAIGDTIDSMGTWFTTDKEGSKVFGKHFNETGKGSKEGAIVEADISINNPKIFESETEARNYFEKFRKKEKGGGGPPPKGSDIVNALEKEGYDGIIIKGGERGLAGGDYYLSFNNKGVTVRSVYIPPPEAAARTTEAPAGNVAETPEIPTGLAFAAKSPDLHPTLPGELRKYSDLERVDIAKALGTTDTSPEALSEALIDKFAVNKTEKPSPYPAGDLREKPPSEIDELIKSEEGIGSEGPGAASAAEKLASYEERKFGKRFVEDKRIAQEIREGTGNRYYEPIPNKITAEESANLVNQRGIAKSIEDIKDEANGLQPHIRNTMGQVVILRLNEAYRNLKDKAPAEAETILNQATDLAEWQMDYGTRLGQGVQAFAMWARLTPEGKLLAFKRMVKKARDRHRTESQGEVEEIIEGVQAGQAKNAVTRAATKTAETKGIWERYKDQIAGNLAKRLDEASSQSPALQEFSRRLQANIADLVPKPESAKRAALTPAEAFREVVTNWDKYKEAWERTKEEVSKSLSQSDEMVMQSVEAAMGELRSAADTRSFGKLLRETLKKHDTEITGLIDKGEIADATNRTITYIEDAIGFKLDSTQRAGIEKSITGQLDQISINRAKAAAERQRKAIEGEANKIAKVLSDTPTFDKTAKNEALALIRAHLKEPQADFVEKIKAFGADEKTANSLDRMAAENRRRIELIRELETLGRPEKEAVSIAESMAKDLSDVPTWNDKTPSEVKALIREHSTTGVEDFAVKMKALGITDRTIELVDRIAAENRRRVVAVDRASRVEQLRKQYTRPVAKKIPKELWQRLVELGDANLLNEQSFYDVVSQKLGLPNYDKPTVAKLTELANVVRDAAEGVPRDKAIFELNRFIAHQKGFSATDLPIGIYYGNILSGYNTHIVNSLDTFLNVVSEVNGLAATNPRAASQIYAGLFRGLSEGRLDALNALTEGRMVTDGKWMEAPRLMEAARFGEKGGVPILEGTQTGRLTKRLSESKPATVLNAWKYVSRALGASDAIMFRGAKEARAALLAFRMAEAEGLKGDAVDARVREILGNDKMQDFLDQAKREGLSGREAETHARILREMARNKDLSSDSADFAGEATYNHKPHGMLGYFAEQVGKASEQYPTLKLFVPFTRIVANVTNRGLNWTPYGYKRAWKGYSKGEPLNPEQRQQMLFRATAGTASLVALGTLHQLGVITINGAGPSDREKRRQLKETGWRPYSIRVGNTYYTYTYTPVGLGLSVLGNWFDSMKYHELEKKDAATRAAYAVTQMGSTVFSQSFLSGLSKLFQMVSDRSADSIQAFKQTVSSTAGAMTTPTLFRDIERLFDPKIYQSNTLMEDLIKNTPFAFLKLKPTLNAFGEPVTPYRNRFIGRVSSDPAWKLVSDLGVRIPVPGKNTELKKDVQFTPQQYYRLQENSGKRMKKWILEEGPPLRGLTNDQAQDVVDRTASAIFSQEANRIRSGQ